MKIILLSVVLSAMASAVVALQPEPVEDPGPATATPVPIECPPPTFTWKNTQGETRQIDYVCEGSHGGSTSLEQGHSVQFRDNCTTGCGQTCECIECGIIKFFVNGVQIWSCDLQALYASAYGVVVTDKSLPSDLPKPVYDRIGNRMQQWAIPIIDEDGALTCWDFTTIEPRFSVEKGEVIIRDLQGRVIGCGREGVTIDD